MFRCCTSTGKIALESTYRESNESNRYKFYFKGFHDKWGFPELVITYIESHVLKPTGDSTNTECRTLAAHTCTNGSS